MAKHTPKLVYDEDEEGWTGVVQLPALADCAIRWSVNRDAIDGPHEPEQTKAQRTKLPVVVLSESGDEPTGAQHSALEKFLVRQDTICSKVLKYALKELSGVYYDESLPALEDCNGKSKSIRRRFNTVAGFQELVEPTCLYVREEEKGGVAYLAIDFNTALDVEHGFSVLLHDGKPVGWAGAGEMGGEVPAEAPAGSEKEFDAEINALADARVRFADLLKAAVDPKTAQSIIDKLPGLIEELAAATAPVNARINEARDTVAMVRRVINDPRFKQSEEKLIEQLRRIAGDKRLCKVLDPAMKNMSGWKT